MLSERKRKKEIQHTTHYLQSSNYFLLGMFCRSPWK